MNRISILDCTLRDGGYVNNFNFGEKTIKDIIGKLASASIDIIECGFLESNAFDQDKSLYGSVEALERVIGNKNPHLMYVAMIQYGGISNEEICICNHRSIDGIRLTFHEHEIEEAFILGQQLMDKGYKVFMQPVGTMTYTDEALLKLIVRINELNPFAFYMVDTLGTMYKNDLLRMFYLIDHNLKKNIVVGFHSHNNLQLSFANAQELLQLNTPRSLIIDASVFGMGRGAGNLNTELVTQYINANFKLQYDNLEILKIIDEYIRPLSLKYKWGYDAAYYIASMMGCHPNYASFLMNKQTMHIQDIHAILRSLSPEKKALFDREYAGQMYLQYMNHHIDDKFSLDTIKKIVANRDVLLLASGASLQKEFAKINELVESGKYCVMSVNFIPNDIEIETMFISNLKRFKDVKQLVKTATDSLKIIATSNIAVSDEKLIIVDYSSYINEEQCVADNAGLMCINMLKKIGVRHICLAGFDGFSLDVKRNFYEESMQLEVENERLLRINKAMTEKLAQYNGQMKITFVTDSIYNS